MVLSHSAEQVSHNSIVHISEQLSTGIIVHVARWR